MIKFSVTGRIRKKDTFDRIQKRFAPYKDMGKLESVYGFFLDKLKLYGGRGVDSFQLLTEDHIEQVYDMGANIGLVTSNSYFDGEFDDREKAVLDELHREGNYVVVSNDEMAKKFREEYPKFKINASTIKNLHKIEDIEKALEIYDKVVLRPYYNDDLELLESIKDKDKIIIFTNSKCGYWCKSQTCWDRMSRMHRGEPFDDLPGYCPLSDTKTRLKVFPEKYMIKTFDIQPFIDMGYTNFKVIEDWGRNEN